MNMSPGLIRDRIATMMSAEENDVPRCPRPALYTMSKAASLQRRETSANSFSINFVIRPPSGQDAYPGKPNWDADKQSNAHAAERVKVPRQRLQQRKNNHKDSRDRNESPPAEHDPLSIIRHGSFTIPVSTRYSAYAQSSDVLMSSASGPVRVYPRMCSPDMFPCVTSTSGRSISNPAVCRQHWGVVCDGTLCHGWGWSQQSSIIGWIQSPSYHHFLYGVPSGVIPRMLSASGSSIMALCAPRIDADERNGLVGRKMHTKSGFSSRSNTAGSSQLKSGSNPPDGDRKIPSAPYLCPIDRYPSESEATYTRSPAPWPANNDHTSSGTSPRSRTFFPDIRVLPARAGTMAITSCPTPSQCSLTSFPPASRNRATFCARRPDTPASGHHRTYTAGAPARGRFGNSHRKHTPARAV